MTKLETILDAGLSIAIGNPDDCWEWTGSRTAAGYGRIVKTGGNHIYAHRVVYELENGKIPDGMVVRHSCDNPGCCNPKHLLVGSQKDNMADCVERDRQCRGERNGKSKLTDDQVLSILRDDRTQQQIADYYGMSRAMIGLIKQRKNWRHLS